MVYQLITDGEIIRIIVISIRDDEAVYREAEEGVNFSVSMGKFLL